MGVINAKCQKSTGYEALKSTTWWTLTKRYRASRKQDRTQPLVQPSVALLPALLPAAPARHGGRIAMPLASLLLSGAKIWSEWAPCWRMWVASGWKEVRLSIRTARRWPKGKERAALWAKQIKHLCVRLAILLKTKLPSGTPTESLFTLGSDSIWAWSIARRKWAKGGGSSSALHELIADPLSWVSHWRMRLLLVGRHNWWLEGSGSTSDSNLPENP